MNKFDSPVLPDFMTMPSNSYIRIASLPVSHGLAQEEEVIGTFNKLFRVKILTQFPIPN